MKVIVISGKAQHGKDTTAGFMKSALESDGYSVLIAHYGDLVKYICKTFFGWDGQKDEYGRSLLQRIGTDVIRAQDQDYWVRFIGTILWFFKDEWDYVLIPDCRFPNEVNYLGDNGFDVIHKQINSRFFGKVKPRNIQQQLALDIFAKITNDSNEGKVIEVKAGDGFMQAIFIPYGITYSDSADGVRNGGMGSTGK